MNDFASEVALIWARSNATASAGFTATDFAAGVVAVALETQRLFDATAVLVASPESDLHEKSPMPSLRVLNCLSDKAIPAETKSSSER